MTHWKRPRFWERLRGGGKGGNRGEMAGWYHRLNGHEFEQTQGDSEGQGGLVCCSPWDHEELDTVTENQQQTSGARRGGRRTDLGD